MSACRFLIVPDPSVHGPGRVVRCNRLPDEHPVKGGGRFVNHRNWLDDPEEIFESDAMLFDAGPDNTAGSHEDWDY